MAAPRVRQPAPLLHILQRMQAQASAPAGRVQRQLPSRMCTLHAAIHLLASRTDAQHAKSMWPSSCFLLLVTARLGLGCVAIVNVFRVCYSLCNVVMREEGHDHLTVQTWHNKEPTLFLPMVARMLWHACHAWRSGVLVLQCVRQHGTRSGGRDLVDAGRRPSTVAATPALIM
jgi:hypothetical protein